MTMGTETIVDEKKKTPGTGRGTGRRPGSKNKISTEVKQNVAEFFKTCTIESLRWRTNMRRKLEMAADSAEFIQLSRLALSYSPGLPVKMQVDGEKRKSLVFVTTSGLYPWDERMDNMKSQTDAMLAQGKAEERLQLEAAKKPVAVDADKTDRDSEVPEALELVEPPPGPEDFGGRR
jgi:hypothetical protein